METSAVSERPLSGPGASSPQTFLWLGFDVQDSVATMERDRVYFEALKKGSAAPALRFYRWQRPTLSYGRTQGLDDASRQAALQKNHLIVQRPTGGGKVWHGNDLCFSLFWTRAEKNIPWKVGDSYCAIHKWIQHCLDERGLATNLSASPEEAPEQNKSWCFQSPVRHDLISGGQKIVGGAQWRDGNYALHQGSIQTVPSAGPRDGEALELFRSSFEKLFGVRFL